MSIHGKLVAWLLLSILSFGAGVTASVDENPVIAGESVELAIEAEGEEVLFPRIDKIGEYDVTAEGSQRLERFEDNRSVVKWIKLYAFTPKKSVTIPSFRVVVDGKQMETSPIFIQVESNSSRRSDDFLIALQSDRKEAYVGQVVQVTVRFKEKRDIPVMNVDFVPIKYENFWVKRVGREKRYSEGNYLVHEIRYLFFPQKPGSLTIGPAVVKVAIAKKMRDAFGFIVRQPKWITVTSSPLTLDVKPLPDDLKLVGDFRLHVDAEPRRVDAGKPVRLSIRVEAEGNIEDFDLPPLRIDGVTVYSDAPKIEQRYSHGIYSGTWEKRYVLIADRPFVIPPFSLRYFDPKREKIERLESDPIRIEVRGDALSKKRTDEIKDASKPTKEKRNMMVWLYGSSLIAFFVGMAAMYLISRWRERRGRDGKKRFCDVDGEAKMLQRLMPYISKSKEAAQMAENLYAAIFEGKSTKIEKKVFEKLMEELKRSR
ncbi:BatD family protein [Hydrogenimonas cancrithermarum]|uniref:BatD n=1 Tax=Hydrogenimonas cancrithermarum TaxID=2993563 RepID=A0ABN6WTW9_9BACT|nr:BatD family protein [Hydrogenimonas cancrithermarum]BDY12564.1 hypothetical protein HCR_08760 [Hydrogenimonas cancrithermarum]